jgi:hypothetical protein
MDKAYAVINPMFPPLQTNDADAAVLLALCFRVAMLVVADHYVYMFEDGCVVSEALL